MNLVSMPQHQRKASGQLQVISYVLLVVPIICFSILLFTYAVNVPWMDDIDAFLSFMVGYIDAPTLGDKLDWLLRPNNEHRILMAKLITLAMYKLTGTVNFRWLVFAAFVFLLGIIYVFYRLFRSIKLPLLAFVPIVFLVLQPQYYLTSIWAITGLQHLVTLSLTLAAIYCLASGSRNRFVGAIFIQIVASLSMSNGLFGWVAGAVMLALQRQWIRLTIWLILGVATIVFYFHDFPNGQGNESSVSFFLHYPYLVFFGFFTFIGGLFDFLPNATILVRSVLPTFGGFVFVSTMLWLLWRMNWPLLRGITTTSSSDPVLVARQKRRYFFTGCYAFLMVNAVIVAFLRPRFGYDVMLVSNYMIYSAILVSLLYLNVLSEYGIQSMPMRWVQFGLLFGLGIWGFWYITRLPKIALRKELLLTSAFNQKHNETGLGASWGTPFATLAKEVMGKAIRKGIYQYPVAYFTPYEQDVLAGRQIKSDSTLDLQLGPGDYSNLVKTDYGALPYLVNQAAVVIQSDKNTYLFPSDVSFTPATFFLNRPVRTLNAEIIRPILPRGHYRIGILAPAGKEKAIQFSQQTLTIP